LLKKDGFLTTIFIKKTLQTPTHIDILILGEGFRIAFKEKIG